MSDNTANILASLFASQPFAILSTEGHGQPYGSVVAIFVTADNCNFIFATPRGTRKFDNLRANPRAALTFDNRSNTPADCREAVAATVLGAVRELNGEDRRRAAAEFLARHPHLTEFVAAPDSALMSLAVEICYLVTDFQKVVEYRPNETAHTVYANAANRVFSGGK